MSSQLKSRINNLLNEVENLVKKDISEKTEKILIETVDKLQQNDNEIIIEALNEAIELSKKFKNIDIDLYTKTDILMFRKKDDMFEVISECSEFKTYFTTFEEVLKIFKNKINNKEETSMIDLIALTIFSNSKQTNNELKVFTGLEWKMEDANNGNKYTYTTTLYRRKGV